MTQIEQLLKSIEDHMAKVGGAQATALTDIMKEHLVKAFPIPAAQSDIFKSAGQQIAESEAIKQYVAAKMAGNSAPALVDLPGFALKPGTLLRPGEGRWLSQTKDITTSDFPSPRTYLPLPPIPRRRARVRDLMNVAGVGTPQIEFPQVTGFSNSATGQTEGDDKPLVDINTAPVVASAKTIAAFLPVTRQALEDVPQLRAWLDTVLELYLADAEDDQIIDGSGGANLTGILNTSGILTPTTGATRTIDKVRQGKTAIQTSFVSSGFEPNGVILHPNDWEEMELAVSAVDGQYLLKPPGTQVPEGAAPRLWGMDVVVTPAMTEGHALLGAFDVGAGLWVYHGLQIRVTDSHDDWFRKNLLAMVAEFREILTVYFPGAFADVTL